MTDHEFLAAFDAGQLDPKAFPHAAHVRAAWLCLREAPFRDGVARLRRGLKHLAIKAGQPGHYHETITVAYARLIHQRMRQLGPHTWPEFEARARDFFTDGMALLRQIYDDETLRSEEARQRFVPPVSWNSAVVDRFLHDFASYQAEADARAMARDGPPVLEEPSATGVEPVSAMAVFAVSSVERAVEWYARVFGFDATPYPARPPYTLALLTRGGAELMLRRADGPVQAPAGWALCIRLSGGGIRDLHEQLAASDDPVSPLRRMPYRDVEFEVRDPDGYVILVSEFLDEAADGADESQAFPT